MKRALIAVCVAACAAVAAVAGSNADVDPVWFYSVAEGRATVTNVSPAVGDLAIPPAFGKYPVTGIGRSAFSLCEEIVSIGIPSNVTLIGDLAFYGCSGLKSFKVDENNAKYRAVDGFLCSKDGTMLIQGVNGEVTIPTNVTHIADEAFYGYGGLVSVSIPTNVTWIGKRAFDDTPFYAGQPDGLLVFGQIAYGVKGSCPPDVIVPTGVATIGESAFENGGLVSVTIPTSVTRIGGNAFEGCRELAVVYVCGTGEVERVRGLYGWREGVEFRDMSVYSCVIGEKVSFNTGFLCYEASGLPPSMSYDRCSGVVSGSVGAAGEYRVMFTKTDAKTEVLLISVSEENVSVDVEVLAATALPVGLYGRVEIPVVATVTGVKSVSVSGLPQGLAFDRETLSIVGAPTKVGVSKMTVTVTTVGGTTRAFEVTMTVAAMPGTVVGTFNGFMGRSAEGASAVCGTLAFTVSEGGKLTAKVMTVAGTRSMSVSHWDSFTNGVYAAKLSNRKGEELDLALDANAAWDACQLSGTFSSGEGTFWVSAQRRPFPMTYEFTATGDPTNGWALAYAPNAKSAALTVKVKEDGSSTLTGKIGGFKVRASSSVDVSGRTNGVLFADFVQVVSVRSGRKSVKRPLFIRTNLWFDRRADHAEGVGTAVFGE